MKALSVKQPWAGYIASGKKSIETRSWRTNYRGELLICASLKGDSEMLASYTEPENQFFGMALCLVNLVSCTPFYPHHKGKALCSSYGGYSWHLENIRKVFPVPVKGQLSIFNLPIETENLIEILK